MGSIQSKKRRKMERVRNLMIRTAKELFTKKSYEEVTMEEIAEEALLSKATLYNYFQNKEALLFSIGIDDIIKVVMILKNLDFTGKSGLERLIILLRETISFFLNNPLALDIISRFQSYQYQSEEKTQEISKKFEDLVNEKINILEINSMEIILPFLLKTYLEFADLYRLTVQEGMKDGSIKSDLDLNQTLVFLNLFFFGIVNQIQKNQNQIKNAGLKIDKIVNIFLSLIETYLKS
ncbi:MAG: TetR/AcrR family transcriptional regulator [Promethearchaeota archaeon]